MMVGLLSRTTILADVTSLIGRQQSECFAKREEDGRSLCFPVPVGGVFPPSSGKELSVPATQVSSVKI